MRVRLLGFSSEGLCTGVLCVVRSLLAHPSLSVSLFGSYCPESVEILLLFRASLYKKGSQIGLILDLWSVSYSC